MCVYMLDIVFIQFADMFACMCVCVCKYYNGGLHWPICMMLVGHTAQLHMHCVVYAWWKSQFENVPKAFRCAWQSQSGIRYVL